MKLKSLLLVVLAFLATVAAPAKKKNTTPEDQNKVYIFGFATTFDSDVVYITRWSASAERRKNSRSVTSN